MSFRFFRSFGGRWLRFNVSKKGVSCSVGKRGLATATLSSRGTVSTNINAPVKGLSYRKQTKIAGITPAQQKRCNARPFGPHNYPRKQLEAMHIAALDKITELEHEHEINAK